MYNNFKFSISFPTSFVPFQHSVYLWGRLCKQVNLCMCVTPNALALIIFKFAVVTNNHNSPSCRLPASHSLICTAWSRVHINKLCTLSIFAASHFSGLRQYANNSCAQVNWSMHIRVRTYIFITALRNYKRFSSFHNNEYGRNIIIGRIRLDIKEKISYQK